MSKKHEYHKAIELKFLEDVTLEVTFDDGLVKRFDMSDAFEAYPPLKALEDRSLFLSGQLLSFVIIWNDLLDIETEEIYERGTTIRKVDPHLKVNVGSPVAFARFSRNLSQAELAKKAGIDQSDLSKIERGVANPSVRTLIKIAEALDCSLSIRFEPKDPSVPLFYPELSESGFLLK